MNDQTSRSATDRIAAANTKNEVSIGIVNQRVEQLIDGYRAQSSKMTEIAEKVGNIDTYMRMQAEQQKAANEIFRQEITRHSVDIGKLSERLTIVSERVPGDVMPGREIARRFGEHDKRLTGMEAQLDGNHAAIDKLAAEVAKVNGRITTALTVVSVLWTVGGTIVVAAIKFWA